MRRIQEIWLLAGFILVAAVARAADPLAPEEASAHIAEQAQVCGIVASAKFASESRGQPTFLNLGKPYPDHVFTALVWGSNRRLFSDPLESLDGEHICVEGIVSEYRGKPQITVSHPSQITRPASH